MNVSIFLMLRNSYTMQNDDTRPNVLQHKKEPGHRLLYRDERKLNKPLYRGYHAQWRLTLRDGSQTRLAKNTL